MRLNRKNYQFYAQAKHHYPIDGNSIAAYWTIHTPTNCRAVLLADPPSWFEPLRFGQCRSGSLEPDNGISKFDYYAKYLGGDSDRVTPVPIPNTEVKPVYVDGTAWETVWESRKPPGLN